MLALAANSETGSISPTCGYSNSSISSNGNNNIADETRAAFLMDDFDAVDLENYGKLLVRG